MQVGFAVSEIFRTLSRQCGQDVNRWRLQSTPWSGVNRRLRGLTSFHVASGLLAKLPAMLQLRTNKGPRLAPQAGERCFEQLVKRLWGRVYSGKERKADTLRWLEWSVR